MIPKNKPLLDIDSVREIVASRGLEDEDLVVVGIRGYYEKSMGNPKKNDRGIYDDAFFIVTKDKVYPFNANTDPSAYKHGIATLKTGLWKFIPGKHKIADPKGYPAFRQYGNVTVTRDGKADDTGYFGINLHKGGIMTTSSLGCQTVPSAQWLAFRDIILGELGVTLEDIRKNPNGVPNKQFHYLLLDKSQAEEIIKKKI